MITCLRLILASLAFAAALTAHAESSSVRPSSGRPPGPLLDALDSDHDGTLSVTEIASAPLALAALDLNGDGIISSDEWRATRADGRLVRVGRGFTAFNIAFTLDANHDGIIQSMEVANAVSSLKRLDANGDGQLTPGELRPAVGAHQHSQTPS